MPNSIKDKLYKLRNDMGKLMKDYYMVIYVPKGHILSEKNITLEVYNISNVDDCFTYTTNPDNDYFVLKQVGMVKEKVVTTIKKVIE